MGLQMQVLGHYQLLEEIGRGGMGVVYRGLDTAIGRTVAIKTIAASQVPDGWERQQLRERLSREARSAGILSHPAIVTIFHFGTEGDDTYIVMEFVAGETLSQRLRRGPVSPREVVSIVNQVADALDYAHQQGVIHRDIKPSNIMVRADGKVKITDFGIAKLLSHTATQTGTTVGSPHYMSPEQVQGKTVDGRSDQYSLGVLAFEMLTGQRPFEGDTLTTLIYQIVFQEPAFGAVQRLPGGESIALALRRAMAKSPNDRYPSCAAFAEALAGAIEEARRAFAVTPRPSPKPASPPAAPVPLKARTVASPIPAKWLAGAGAGALVIAIAAGTMLLTSRSTEPPAPSTPVAVVPEPPFAKAEPSQTAPPKAAMSKPEAAKVQPPASAVRPAVQTKQEAPRFQAVQAKPEAKAEVQPALVTSEPKLEPPGPQPVIETKPEPAPPPVADAGPEPKPQIPSTLPVLIRRVSPIYPDDARREGIQGAVQLQIDIDENGVPSNPRVVRSLHPSLDERAKETVLLWRFRPATVDGRPVPLSARVEVNFSLVGAPSRSAPSLKKR